LIPKYGHGRRIVLAEQCGFVTSPVEAMLEATDASKETRDNVPLPFRPNGACTSGRGAAKRQLMLGHPSASAFGTNAHVVPHGWRPSVALANSGH
jgi:hypothetical protein